ncbi:MAG TPA: flagellar hook-associated protein FlgL [Firmicutes bacterium]|nr:flagellar hook-associated protein FlgL [Bacillota bacterium]
MRVSNSLLFNTLMTDIGNFVSRMEDLRQQIATGKSLQTPADDPLGASRAVAIRALLSGAEQYEKNIRDAREWLYATETALTHVVDILAKAKDIAIKGANDTLSDDARQALAYEVGQLFEELLGRANSQHEGRYLFAGLKTGTKPFEATGGPPPTGANYVGDHGVKEIDAEDGFIVAVNFNGDNVFKEKDLFATLANLRDHLLAGDSAAITTTDIANLDAGIDHLSQILGQIGSRTARLDRANERIQDDKIKLAGMLSKVEDSDLAKSMVALQMQEVIYKSALAAASHVIRPTLLDFLR